jgi:molybdopterin converting factor small subunit
MRILFFAQTRQATGTAEAVLEADALEADALWALLLARWPGLAPSRGVTRLARNGAYARPGEVFRADDEVALIPPVSGG